MVEYILNFFAYFIFGIFSFYGMFNVYYDLKCKIFKKKKGYCDSFWCRARKICPYSEDFISKNIYGRK